jgi:hypothetical protein
MDLSCPFGWKTLPRDETKVIPSGERGGMIKMKDKIWKYFSDVFFILEMFIFVAMISSLCFAFGYHIGFKSGLDTKVTYVSETYIMKLKNGAKQEMSKPSQKSYRKVANLPREMAPDTVDGMRQVN